MRLLLEYGANPDLLCEGHSALSLAICSGNDLVCNISNTRDSVSSGYPNTEKRVENLTRIEVFLTKFEVFGLPMKHWLECLIFPQSKQILRSKWQSEIVKSMLTKTRYLAKPPSQSSYMSLRT